jgi:hypothetical protein
MTIILNNPKKEVATQLAARMEEVLETLPLAVVRKAMEDFEPQKFAQLITLFNPVKMPSIQERNAIAFAKSREQQFGRIRDNYTVFDAKTVCNLLGITKQALSKKAAAGKILAYTYKGRKYYPIFQIVGDKINPAVGKLIEETGFDATDTAQMNVVLGYLMHDAIAVGTNHKYPRYTLISNDADREIMVEDLTRPLEMGQ